MNKGEKQLITTPFTFTFEEKYTIDKKMDILLNSIKIYNKFGINGCMIGEQVDYEIRVIDGKKTIYPLSNSHEYIGMLKRVVNAYKLEIKAKDYIKVDNINGNYSFVMIDL